MSQAEPLWEPTYFRAELGPEKHSRDQRGGNEKSGDESQLNGEGTPFWVAGQGGASLLPGAVDQVADRHLQRIRVHTLASWHVALYPVRNPR
jgi:hypothetical protein